MNYDVLTINALVDELHLNMVGGRVQDVLDVNEHAIGLEIYANRARHYLLLDASPQQPRVHVVPDKLRRGLPKPTQLGLLLRRYVEGGVLTDVTQPPWERLLTLHIESAAGSYQLISETIERRANILLVQEDLILDCIRRVGPDENRVRVSLPGHDYVPPPPQRGKLRPGDVTLADLESFLEAGSGGQAWRALTRRVLGMSPVLARELIYRAVGEPRALAADTSARAVYDALRELLPPLLEGEWQPGNARDEDGDMAAFAVYPLTQFPAWEPAESVSAALAAYYGAPVGKAAYERAKQPVREQLEDATARVSHKLASLRESLKSEEELTHLRQSGELLLAYQYTIQPGTTVFEAEYDLDAPPLTITLDPQLTPLENAQRYFNRYERAKRAQADVPRRIATAKHELAFLKQLATDLDLAASWPEIDEVREALERDGYWRGQKQTRPKGGKTGPLKVVTEDGFVIWVGRNARQNDIVTFKRGGGDDLWLHARGVPGAHVIIKFDGRDVPDNVIEQAAGLAAHYSALRSEKSVRVDVTARKHVRKIRGGKPGMVMYREEQPVEVEPRAPQD